MGLASVLVRRRVGGYAFAISARAALAGMVGVSAVVRFLFGLRRATITYLPDEYTYAALARGIATTGRPVIRGSAAHFPALLEPILAAPFWLTGNVELAFRLTQAESALIMSLGAIPVYLLTRRLGVGSRFALAAAAITLASPSLLYSTFLTADPIAFPLVLGAIYAAVVALDSGSRRAQVAFVLLTGLAAFTRVQYVMLVPVLLGAALIVERGNVRRIAEKIGVALALFAGFAALAVAAGTAHLLGVYGSLSHLDAPGATVLHQVEVHFVLLPLSAGVVLVPGALVALSRGLVRAAPTTERAYAALTLLVGLSLVAQAVFIGSTISGNYGERYLTCFFPLVAPAFCLYAARGGATRVALALSAGLAIIAMRVPIAGYAAGNSKDDSTLLYAAYRAEQLTDLGSGALIASLLVLALAITAGFVALRPTRRAVLAIAVALASQAAVAAGATSWDIWGSNNVLHQALPADPRWVDNARLGAVTFLQAPGGNSGDAEEQMFWNTSLTRLDLFQSTAPTDDYAAPALMVGADGGLTAGGSPVTGPLLVDGLRTWTVFAGMRVVSTKHEYRLLVPVGRPRLLLEAIGLRADGWLGSTGAMRVWPGSKSMRLTLGLSLPKGARADTIHFRLAGGKLRTLRIPGGATRRAIFVIPAGGPWTLRYSCDRFTNLGDGQAVSFRAARPELVPIPLPS